MRIDSGRVSAPWVDAMVHGVVEDLSADPKLATATLILQALRAHGFEGAVSKRARNDEDDDEVWLSALTAPIKRRYEILMPKRFAPPEAP